MHAHSHTCICAHTVHAVNLWTFELGKNLNEKFIIRRIGRRSPRCPMALAPHAWHVAAECVALAGHQWVRIAKGKSHTHTHSMPGTTVELRVLLLFLLLLLLLLSWLLLPFLCTIGALARRVTIRGDLLLEIFCMLLIEMQAGPRQVSPFG